jgi:5-methylcytosine-specific restriction enzyme B
MIEKGCLGVTKLSETALRDIFNGEFRTALNGDWADWRRDYLLHVDHVRRAQREEWLTPTFQKNLWDSKAVANVGPGQSVAVEGAYSDQPLSELLLSARDNAMQARSENPGVALQEMFEKILGSVADYNKRRPLARVVRLLATLFPSDMTCLMDERRLWQTLQLVGGQRVEAGFIAHHPILRQRLREVLGATPTLADDVDQSMFTWFLWTKLLEKPESGAVTVTSKQTVATDIPNLSLLPPDVQRSGLVHVRDNVGLLAAIILECEQGVTRQDLISFIQRQAPNLKAAGSAANIISQAQGGLGLIGLHDGAYRPTERGLELLSNPDPARVLQPLLIERVFGMGHLLLALKNQPNGLGQRVLAEQIARLVPTRKSAWAGGEMISWGVSSKLVRQESGQIVLTDDGAAYAEVLPEDFATRWGARKASPEAEVTGEVEGDMSEQTLLIELASPAFVSASWEMLRDSFAAGELSSKLILPDGFVAELHAALHASDRKRFVLLSGLSGTGKTSIARAYAEAYCSALGLANWISRYEQTAVRPDWSDPTGLLGFVNALIDPPSFQAAAALNVLLAADRDRSRPYFLCLDEMNLARVEHYFAPFLSAMEGEDTWLALHGELEPIDNVMPRIRWPKNLFIFGTVNMDESTHPFSDKVLDRAFTFEFWEVDLSRWTESKRSIDPSDEILKPVSELLHRLYDALAPARRHFGYRTADEVFAYCRAGISALPLQTLLDSAILMKVLPRVRGDDAGPLKMALSELSKIADPALLPRTRRKIDQMATSLDLTGQARFWA